MQIRFLIGLLLAVSGCFAAAAPAFSEYDVAVPMRDRVYLSTNVFRPAGFERYPTILLRTPYDKGTSIAASGSYQSFVNHGYAVVVQDVRGRYKSGGNFEPINQEINDGDDTLNWIASQAWSDGKVGMYGGSYVGIAQWKAAMSHNPHLKAIFPYVSGDDDYRDRFYSTGGALKLGQALGRPAAEIATQVGSAKVGTLTLTRQMDYEAGRKLGTLGIPGLILDQTSRRYYPEGDKGAPCWASLAAMATASPVWKRISIHN